IRTSRDSSPFIMLAPVPVFHGRGGTASVPGCGPPAPRPDRTEKRPDHAGRARDLALGISPSGYRARDIARGVARSGYRARDITLGISRSGYRARDTMLGRSVARSWRRDRGQPRRPGQPPGVGPASNRTGRVHPSTWEHVMHRASGPVIALLLSAAVGACGAGDGGRGAVAHATVDTVAGVERLLYPGHGGGALRWKADTVAVIGGALVDEDAYHFDQVTADGLASDGAGRLHVLDRAGRRVLVYDAEGRHLATYGRPGGGPGEIGSPSALAVGPGDSIWVADIG